jgi:hypothetical protein
MKGLDAKTLAAMRAIVPEYYGTTVQVQNAVEVLDAFGKATTVYQNATPDPVQGQVSGISGQAQKLVDGLRTQGLLKTRTAMLSLTWGTDLSVGQVVLISGTRWNVVHVDGQATLGTQVLAIITTHDILSEDRTNHG